MNKLKLALFAACPLLAIAFIFSCADTPDFPSLDDSSSSGTTDVFEPCGEGYYNPATHFCLNNIPYKRCGGEEYDPATYACDTRDNKMYKYGVIGGKAWMLENLNYSENNTLGYCYGCEGDDIIELGHEDWETCDNGFGRLYRWAEVSKNLPQGLCPDGWHIPSATEWQSVINTYSSLPAAFYIYSGNYNSNPKWDIGWNDKDCNGFYWTSDAVSYYALMVSKDGYCSPGAGTMELGNGSGLADIFSVRCIRD